MPVWQWSVILTSSIDSGWVMFAPSYTKSGLIKVRLAFELQRKSMHSTIPTVCFGSCVVTYWFNDNLVSPKMTTQCPNSTSVIALEPPC